MKNYKDLFSADQIRSYLRKLSEAHTDRYFTTADIAVYGLKNASGGSKKPDEKTIVSATHLVNTRITGIMKGKKDLPNKSIRKVEPMAHHFPYCGLATGYRYGEIMINTVNGLVPRSVFIRENAPQKGQAPEKPLSLEDQRKQDAEELLAIQLSNLDDKTGQSKDNSTKSNMVVAVAAILQELNFYELNEVRLEIDVLQQEMFEGLNNKLDAINKTSET